MKRQNTSRYEKMTDAESAMQGSIWVCATENGSYAELGEVSDLKLKVDGKDIDTSNNKDAGWGSSIAGAKSAEISGTNNLIMSDAGYAIMEAALFSATMTVYVKILQDGTPTSSPVGWSGLFRISSNNFTLVGTSTQQKLDFTLKNVGAIAKIT
jgi:predicted secreted protein